MSKENQRVVITKRMLKESIMVLLEKSALMKLVLLNYAQYPESTEPPFTVTIKRRMMF